MANLVSAFSYYDGISIYGKPIVLCNFNFFFVLFFSGWAHNYSPLLSLIMIFKVVIIFYVKWVSIMK